jgi:HPt (histidine-containing phosphotransfer) domain-containing protein
MSTRSTYSHAQEDKEMLTELFDDSDTGNGVFNALTKIKGNLRYLKVKHMKRPITANCLCQKQSDW